MWVGWHENSTRCQAMVVATSPCGERCWVWTLPPGSVLIFIPVMFFHVKRVVSSLGNAARCLLPTSLQGRSQPVGHSQAPTCFSSPALRILLHTMAQLQ